VTADELRLAAINIGQRSADAQGVAERAVDPVTLQLVAEIVAGPRHNGGARGSTGASIDIDGPSDCEIARCDDVT